MPYKDKEKQKTAHKEWREKNKHILAQKAKARYEVTKEKKKAYQKKYYWANRDECLARDRRIRYGITPEQHTELLETQNGKCKLCEQELKLFVDHCHETGKIRGLLCHGCNAGLGNFKDNKHALSRAIEYLS